MRSKSISKNVFALGILIIILMLNSIFTPYYNQNYGNNITPIKLPTLPAAEIAAEQLSYSSNENEMPSSRTRYLDHIIRLNDPEVQLTVISGDAFDCSYNIAGGSPIATGDIDHDGYEDVLLGCPYADGPPENRWSAGQVFVIFGGTQTHPYTIYDQAKNPEKIDIIIHGSDNSDLFGAAVVCGDIDGDSYDDIIIAAPYGDSQNNQRQDGGEVYVIYGDQRNKLDPEIDLRSTAPGIIIHGATRGDRAGYSVAVGDVISDNKKDIIIGATLADPANRVNAGMVYIIAGDSRANLGLQIDLLELVGPGRSSRAKPEIRIEGVSPDDRTGFSVAAGDVNGNGRDDIIIGARQAQRIPSRNNSGVTYIIYGKQTLPTKLNLTFEADVYIYGADANDHSGYSLAAGDINGDSYEDILIGAIYADGPNNGQRNSGEAYIISGSANLPQIIDTFQNQQDIIIYGENAWDHLGYSVAMGEVDDDEYTDFLIGVRHGDGEFNGEGDAGETFLIMGNTSANFGTSIDPITNSKSIFYGIDAGDNAGMFVELGDLDGDGFDDVLIGASFADGPVDGRDSAGEFYFIYTKPPSLTNEFLILINGDVDNKTIFSRYKAYTFRINVSNILGLDDFKSVILVLDPLGYNLAYRWSMLDNEFSCVNDPLKLVECVSTITDVQNDGLYNYSIDFKLKFNWTFTHFDPIDCGVYTEGIMSYQDSDQFDDIFYVKNKLNLVGELQVEGADQGELANNSWALGTEELTFSGLTVVYDGTTGYYPPVTEYSLVIVDNKKNWSVANLDLGIPITATVIAPAETGEYSYRFKIMDIPSDSDNSNLKITLRIDQNPPIPPANIICKADSKASSSESKVDDDFEIYLSWSPASDLGSGTKGYYYSSKNLGGTTKGYYTENTTVKIVNTTEGLNWFYVWAVDEVGNIGLANSSNIFIDVTEVTFENFTPTSGRWVNSKDVNCTIQIYDKNGFGADSKSIEYLDMKSKKWFPVEMNMIQFDNSSYFKYLNASVLAELAEGENSYIQFRAKDIAGNGPTESKKYYLKIDTTPVTFSNVQPNSTEKLSDQNIRCYVTISDPDGSGVNLSTIQYSYTTAGLGNFSNWNNFALAMVVNKSNPEIASTWFVDLSFKRGSQNFIRWRAIDNAGNGYKVSDNFPISVNAFPVVIIDGIEPEASYKTVTELELNGDQSYDLDDVLQDKNFRWTSNISGIIGEGRVIRTQLCPGKHLITLTIFDGQNYASSQINITVVPPKTPESNDGQGIFGLSKDADLLIIIFIIIIILIIVLFLAVYLHEKKMRKRLEEKALGSGMEYISRYQQLPRAPHGKDLPQLTGGTGVVQGAGGGTEIFSLRASPYGIRSSEGMQPLPAVGGTVPQSTAPSATNTTTLAKQPTLAGTGTVGRNLPQLPPAQLNRYATVQKKPDLKLEIDTNKKMELLEKKMLLGEIPIELYNKLSKKYEEELKSKMEIQPHLADKPDKPEKPIPSLASEVPKIIHKPAKKTPIPKERPKKQPLKDADTGKKTGFETAPGFTDEELEFLRKLRKEK